MAAVHPSMDTFCTMCSKQISKDRQERQAVTCSDECAKQRIEGRRKTDDDKRCRHCRRPSTLEQRAAYARFRRLEVHMPHLIYPQQYEVWASKEDNVTPERFRKYFRAFEKEREKLAAAVEESMEDEPA
jgi:hypothetical protein